MQSIKQIAKLNDLELQKVVPPTASWHTDYRDTAYIYFGGIQTEPELSEGDVLTIFSQYGNPVHIRLHRDKDTGVSKGFGWLKYEDQRSCDLAVDNLSGAEVMGRKLAVDHARYKKAEGEVEGIPNEEDEDGTDEEGGRKRRIEGGGGREESESGEERPVLKEEVELAQLVRDMDDLDPMKAYIVKDKKAEIEEARKALSKGKEAGKEHKRKHRHRSRRDVSDDEGERKHRKHHRSRRESNDKERDRSREGGHHKNRSRRDDRGESDEERDGHRSRRERSRSPYRKRKHSRSAPAEGSKDSTKRERRDNASAERSRSREPYRRSKS